MNYIKLILYKTIIQYFCFITNKTHEAPPFCTYLLPPKHGREMFFWFRKKIVKTVTIKYVDTDKIAEKHSRKCNRINRMVYSRVVTFLCWYSSLKCCQEITPNYVFTRALPKKIPNKPANSNNRY